MTDGVLLNMSEFTPIETKIVALLSDGMIHSIDELLRDCLGGDDLYTAANLRPHITSIRHKVDGVGLLITCTSKNGVRGTAHRGYQMSRRLYRE